MRQIKNIKQAVVACVVTVLISMPAFASGYMIPEQGTKAMGMSNAFSAIADDASANWFNPAGLSFQENNISINGVFVSPVNEFEAGGQTYTAKKTTHFIPQAYIRYGSGNSKISYGLGINSPFGLATDWTDSGAGFSKLTAGASSVTFSEIQGVHINPNIAYQVNDNLSVALGVQYYNIYKVNLDSHALKINGSGDAFGGNIAFMYKTDKWGVGGSYRSKVKVDLTGTEVGGPLLGALNGTSANASTSLTIPDLQTLSIAYNVTSSWLLSAQLDRTNWKTFDKIEITNGAPISLTPVGPTSTIPENWKATVAVRLGTEWKMDKVSRLRAGYTYDPTPTNETDFSPRLPGNDRQLVSIGYGRDLSEDLTMDLAYMYVWLKDRTAAAPTNAAYHGVYKGTVNLFSAAINYRY
jgi:long-chain fatty acid transport protein